MSVEVTKKINQLFRKYETSGFFKAGELLLQPHAAIELSRDLEEKGILILGVDFWFYTNDEIAEDPNSLDLSEVESAKDSCRIARDFIHYKLPKDIAFVSFVLDDD